MKTCGIVDASRSARHRRGATDVTSRNIASRLRRKQQVAPKVSGDKKGQLSLPFFARIDVSRRP
jgi:hypothetical protein